MGNRIGLVVCLSAFLLASAVSGQPATRWVAVVRDGDVHQRTRFEIQTHEITALLVVDTSLGVFFACSVGPSGCKATAPLQPGGSQYGRFAIVPVDVALSPAAPRKVGIWLLDTVLGQMFDCSLDLLDEGGYPERVQCIRHVIYGAHAPVDIDAPLQ